MRITYLLIPGVLGAILFVVGMLFRIQHWPGGALIQMAGAALILFAALLIFYLVKKNAKNRNK